jgi:serine protease Do
MNVFARACLVFVTMSSLAVTSSADVADVKSLSMSFRDAVKKIKPAVVYIEATSPVSDGRRVALARASGSGVIIDAKKGYVLTAAHVIDESHEITVRLEDGREFTAKQKWTDTPADVGLLQIEGENLPQAKLGDSEKLEVGDWVLAIGSPFGRALENSVSAGIVSAKGRKTGVLGQMGIEDFIQTDAVINRGNSGGPLVNIDGEVVGINSNIISSTGMSAGLGFAVPSKLAIDAIEQFEKGGRVVRGYLGVTLSGIAELEPATADKLPEWLRKRGGVWIGNVMPDGPAAEAGMKPGDVVLSIDKKEMVTGSDFTSYISTKMPDDIVKCSVWRNGKTIELSAKLIDRPTNEDVEAAERGDSTSYAYKSIGVMVSDYVGVAISDGGRTRIRAIAVTYVRSNSPADKAGVEVGDVIESVNGKAVPDSRTFERILKGADLKKGISVTVIDEHRERELVIKKP